jgi:hypothetical protein
MSTMDTLSQLELLFMRWNGKYSLRIILDFPADKLS